MKAIETEYNGYRFRSRLEARWAVFFDAIGMKYEYEPEGFELSDGTKYLPDFYFPESDSYFEVKGVMNETDQHKISQFIKESKKNLSIGYSDFSFETCDYYGEDWEYDEKGQLYKVEDAYTSLESKDNSSLVKCPICEKHYFIGENGGWVCPCCDAYDGDKYHNIVYGGSGYWYDSPEPYIEDAIAKARQARFEHGEKP